MCEEEIIKYIKDEIENDTDTFHWFDDIPSNSTRKQIEESIKAHQGLLDLYKKEKEKNIKYKEVISNLNNNWVSKNELKEFIKECKEIRDTKVDYCSILYNKYDFLIKNLEELLEDKR